MLSYLSPAKVNLFFYILSKREDGYHDIASLYQAISLFDIIAIRKASGDNFFCFNNKDLKFDNDNLIVKALHLFRKKTQITQTVEIFLKKNIPVQAGLGGGSSNAATTLWALNELFDRPLGLTELIEISRPIGADTAFFFSSGRAFCSGIGDQFEDVQLKNSFRFFIAKPYFGVSTKEVYANVDPGLIKKIDLSKIKQNLSNQEFGYYNDLERFAFQVEPRLKSIKKHLEKMGFDQVVMTGSGSSFMCFGNGKVQKNEKVKIFPVFGIQKNKKTWYDLC